LFFFFSRLAQIYPELERGASTGTFDRKKETRTKAPSEGVLRQILEGFTEEVTCYKADDLN
jgi:hypothetical protein